MLEHDVMMKEVADSLGRLEVPVEALYGASAARGAENFCGFGPALSTYPEFICAVAKVKRAAALANRRASGLSVREADAIIAACDEIVAGEHWSQFVVPMAEGSGGTSLNMNFNEVIASRANQILGEAQSDPIRSNDHVNLSQSTNDVIPTAIKLACVLLMPGLKDAVSELVAEFRARADESRNVLRTGRTCMQAAQPMTYGQLFDGYAALLEMSLNTLERAVDDLRTVPMGGTAIGTGLGRVDGYEAQIVPALAESFGFDVQGPIDMFAAMQGTDGFQRLSGELTGLATNLGRIAADLVILSSDAASGIGEINLPPVQPGSSIMAGKVNPVVPMQVQQVSFQVHGLNTTVAMACQAGQMEINHFETVIAQSLFDQFALLARASTLFAQKCISGLSVDEDRSYENLASSFGVSTIFLHHLGYEKVAQLAKRSLEEKTSLAQIAIAEGLLARGEIRDVLMDATQP
ncbi:MULTISPECIES: lyase family protein [unclassified Roseovarius]|uniref:lyase family protein n=1 Tax=unclassified Roseovarius TaxID=2614913 RepID=UPI00273DEE16|nr:lyase family protein [Roseovarius sp. MMSF_3350]